MITAPPCVSALHVFATCASNVSVTTQASDEPSDITHNVITRTVTVTLGLGAGGGANS